MPERKSRIAVTGANGFIGGEIVRHFAAIGWDVLALARRAPAGPSPGITHVPYALDRPPAAEDLAGARALVHCAFAKGELELNVAAAERLLGACRAAGVGQKVFLSSLSASPAARSIYGRQKLAIERLFADEGGAMLRAGLVLGHGGLFASLRDHLRAGRPVPVIGGGRQPIQVIALSDLVRAVEIVIERNLGGLLVVAHPDAVPYREFYRTVGARMGLRPRLVPVPYYLINAMLFLAESLGLRLPITRDNLLGLRAMTYIDPREHLARLGLAPKTLQQALADLS